MGTKKPPYPSQIGFAGDFLVPITYPKIHTVSPDLSTLVYLADLLLLYDTVVIRSDDWTMGFLYRDLRVDELKSLLDNGRLRFFAAMNASSFAVPCLAVDEGKPTTAYFSELCHSLSFRQTTLDDPKEVVKQIEEYSIQHQTLNPDKAAEFQEQIFNCLEEEFYKIPTARGQERYHIVGLRNGIGRILDVWSTGTLATYIDPEFYGYLPFIKPQQAEIFKPLVNDLGNPVNTFHNMHNLPSVLELAAKGTVSKSDVIKLVLSDDAAHLREWLKENIKPGMDVRDCYVQTHGKLPSKKSWVNWMKFGTATIITTGLAFVLSGSPALAAILGISVGATDVALGNKVVEKLLDPYHPKDWVAMIQRRIDKQEG